MHETLVAIGAGMFVGLVIRLAPGTMIREMLVSSIWFLWCSGRREWWFCGRECERDRRELCYGYVLPFLRRVSISLMCTPGLINCSLQWARL